MGAGAPWLADPFSGPWHVFRRAGSPPVLIGSGPALASLVRGDEARYARDATARSGPDAGGEPAGRGSTRSARESTTRPEASTGSGRLDRQRIASGEHDEDES